MFPRKMIRQIQMGMTDRITASPEPWLCYYCGECSQHCPRQADPGELMMVLRRWLTSRYDWTGLSRRFYASEKLELIAIGIIALVVVLLYLIFLPPFVPTITFQGGVAINQFAPVELIEIGDWTMAVIVASLLISNILHMYWLIIGSDRTLHIPLKSYVQQAWKLIVHFAFQARFFHCDHESREYWYRHWMLMSGYVSMFVVIVVFLKWFQTDIIHPFWHPQRALGYYSTFGLLFGLTYMIAGRWKKRDQKFRFSHPSDWLFLIMLLLTTLTGIFLHFFRIAGLPHATYYMYMAHLAILVPMILIEVPFSKWSHLAYRPFAMYFAGLRKCAIPKPEPAA
jgi:hypothetical protein